MNEFFQQYAPAFAFGNFLLLTTIILYFILRDRKVFININDEFVKLKNIMKYAPNSFFITDITDTIVYANAKALEIYGAKILGTKLTALIEPNDIPKYKDFKVRPKVSLAPLEGESDDHLEIRTIDKTLISIYTDVIVGRWENEPKFTVVFRDISHRHINQQTSRKIFDKFKADCDLLIEGEKLLNCGTWMWDLTTDPDQVTFSSGFAKLFDIPSYISPVTAETLFEVVHKEDVDNLRKTIKDAMDRGVGYDTSYRIRRRNNQVDLVRAVAKPVLSPNGKILKLVGSGQLIKANV